MCCFKTWAYLSALMATTQTCQLARATGPNTPPIPSKMLTAGTKYRAQRTRCPSFPNLYEMWTRQHKGQFSTLCQSISHELKPWDVSWVSGCCWYMAYHSHGRALTLASRKLAAAEPLFLMTISHHTSARPNCFSLFKATRLHLSRCIIPIPGA